MKDKQGIKSACCHCCVRPEGMYGPSSTKVSERKVVRKVEE